MLFSCAKRSHVTNKDIAIANSDRTTGPGGKLNQTTIHNYGKLLPEGLRLAVWDGFSDCSF